MDKPEGYPYTTVVSTLDGHHCAQLIDWSPHGFDQISVVGPREPDYIEAKRLAVQMAQDNGCAFKVPVHG